MRHARVMLTFLCSATISVTSSSLTSGPIVFFREPPSAAHGRAPGPRTFSLVAGSPPRSDWRSAPPDTMCLPIDMIPAEKLAETLNLIGINVDIHKFVDNPTYQEYIEKKFAAYYS